MDENDDIFGSSDDDFLKQGSAPKVIEGEAKASSEAAVVDDEDENNDEGTPSSGSTTPDAVVEPEANDDDKDDEDKEDKDPDDAAALAAKPTAKVDPKPEDAEAAAKAKADAAQQEAPKTAEVAAPEPKPEEYKEFYHSIINAPIKANGKEITLKSPEEVRRMIQMGANYGRKIQDMQPHLKTLRMLEKNDLLDEGKLSFLIDIQQKNPEAIKKLIKDSGIDPLDLNMEDNADYRPTDHTVSDNEIVFDDVLKEVAQLPGGRETIQHVNTEWDMESKRFLWSNPTVLTEIQRQRENGIYDQITTEIDKQKVLGYIPKNTPFLEAYKIAGDSLAASKALSLPQPKIDPKPTTTPAAQADQSPKVLGTRAAAPKTKPSNNDKAKAAGSPVNSSRRASEVINPLDMADDDFLKKDFRGRL